MRRDEGTAALELIIVAPILLAVLAIIVASGRILSTKSSLEEVTRDAARIASQASNADEARSLAQERADNLARELRLDLSRLQVEIDANDFRRGSPMTVSAIYSIRLSDLPAFRLIPGSFQVGARHTELVERFKSR